MTEPRDAHRCEQHPDRVATIVLRSGAYACNACRPPRSWSLPPEPPEDVTRVRDADGIEWERREPGDWRRVGIDHARPYAFSVLISRFGPLTEVVDSE